MRLYIIRHGDPDYANDTLTDLGHQEAAALAERLKRVRLDHLYTSPKGRARATARHTAEAIGREVEILDWTAELSHWRIEQDGPGGPTPCVWDVHGHRVRCHGEMPTLDDWHHHPPFDDPKFHREFARLGQKSDAFLAGHGLVRDGGAYRMERPNDDAIAVFCHGGFGLTWLAHLLAIPLPQVYVSFFLPPTSVTTILFDERAHRLAVPRCIGLGDLSHVYAAGLQDARVPVGIKANYE
ncbi:MAG: histidine phosphatase family protein [Phycisphaeraceae bacterium]